jgi:hypothetical protein
MKPFLACLLLVLSSFATENCSRNKSSAFLPQRSKTVIVEYDDFGPSAMSYEYIGLGFYQWDNEGGDDPNRKFDIKVVVYRNISLDEVRQKYPVINEKQDYRYLEYKAALELLGKYETDPFWNEYRQTKDRAAQAKQRILQQLGT